MRYVFGLMFAAGLLLAPASRANAQVSVSVGYPGYYSYPGYAYSSGYSGVSVNVPGFSFNSGGYYPAVYAAPAATTYVAPAATTYVAPAATTYVAPTYYAPSYYRVRTPYVYPSGYYGYYPSVRVRVGY
jgi:hypothetical protein